MGSKQPLDRTQHHDGSIQIALSQTAQSGHLRNRTMPQCSFRKTGIGSDLQDLGVRKLSRAICGMIW
jgi:hypothetical protein